jgi:hypothetical protein
MSTNEPIVSHRTIKTSSNRSFGLVFASFFAVVAAAPLLSGDAMRLWAAVLAVCFLALTVLAPGLLAPLNRLWSRLGLLLSHVVSPVIMALLYAVLILPAGLLLKAMGRDLLSLNWQPKSPSYWIDRLPPAPQPSSMSKQF